MPALRASLAFLAALAFASGCAAPEKVDVPSDPAAPVLDAGDAEGAPVAGDAGAPPRWRVGDWWTYSVEYVQPPQTFDMTIVVYGVEGADWLVSSTDRAQNIAAEFSHYPTLGAWSANLEGTIHGAKIPFFKWPLTDGKTWDDPYRGIPATWAAKTSDVQTPKGRVPGFDVAMKADDGQYANYSYAPSVGWFTKLEQGFGSPAVRMTLKDSGHAYAGKVSVLQFTEHMHRPLAVLAPDPSTGAPLPQSTQSFTVTAGGTLAWGFYYGGAPGDYSLSFQPVGAGDGVRAGGQTTDHGIQAAFGEVKAPVAGSWVAAGGGVAAAPGFAFGEILEVHDVG